MPFTQRFQSWSAPETLMRILDTASASRRRALVGALALSALSVLGACSSVTGPNCGFRPKASQEAIDPVAASGSCASPTADR